MSISLTDSKNWSGQFNGSSSPLNGKTLILAASELATIWNSPLNDTSFKSLGPGTVKFSGDTPLLLEGTTLSVNGSQGASLGGQVGGSMACVSGEFDDSIDLDKAACLWLKLAGNVSVGVSAEFGGFGIGVKGRSYAEYRYAQVFTAGPDGKFCTFSNALEQLFTHTAPPRDLAALIKAPTGSVFEFDSGGSVTITGSYSVPSSTVPLATSSVPVLKEKLSLQSDASMGVTGSFEISGALVFRVYKVKDKVARFQVFKKRGTAVSVSFDASAGVSGNVAGKDMIDQIFKFITPKLDKLNVAASDAALNDQMKDVLEEAIAQHLSVSLNVEGHASSTQSHLFSIDVDLNVAIASPEMSSRVNALFKGDWTLAQKHNLPCVVNWSDSLEKVARSGHSFHLHLLNIFSAVSVTDFLTSAKVLRAPDGVVFTDHNTASQIGAAGNIAEPNRLSKVLAQALESTLVFKATNGSPAMLDLNVSGSCFQYERNASRDDLMEIELLSAALDCPLSGLQATTTRVGVVKFDATTKYVSAVSDALFVGPAPDYSPKSVAEYMRHALDAISVLYPTTDPFYAAAMDDQLWKHLNQAGNLSAMIQDNYVQGFLSKHGGYDGNPGNPMQAMWLYSIWYTVTFWSKAMAKYAALLQKAKKLAAELAPGDTSKTPQIQELMEKLASAMREAQAQENGFIDARAQFGMTALYLTSGKRSANTVCLTWNSLTKSASNKPALAAAS